MNAPQGIVNGLKFNKNGKFRIMQIADIQDTQITSKDTMKFIISALDKEKPDLVVFTGDQLKGYGVSLLLGDSKLNNVRAIENFIKPVILRHIPFTFIFGNHDAQTFGISKQEQLKAYQQYEECLTVAGDENLEGLANNVLTIKGSEDDKVKYLVYLIDSLQNDPDGGYAAVSQGQIDWYKAVRDYYKEKNGDYVKSMLFQHIPMCEMWNLVKEVPKGTKNCATGYKKYEGKFFDIDEKTLVKGNCDFMLETIASPRKNTGEFDAVSEKGDMVACLFGHDHNNSFIGKYKNVMLGYTQGCGFNVYGPRMNRGVRIIDLDENNLNEFETHTVLYKDFYSSKEINNKLKYAMYTYAPSSVDAAMPIIKKAVLSAAITLAINGAVRLAVKNKKAGK